jgi:tol-pal system protein YbgF
MKARSLASVLALAGALAGCAGASAPRPAAEVAAAPQPAPPAPPVVAPVPEPPRQADALARIASELTELQNAVAKLMLNARQHDDQLLYMQRRLTELETQARNRAAAPVPGFAPSPSPAPAPLPPPPIAPPTALPPTMSPSAAVRPDPAPPIPLPPSAPPSASAPASVAEDLFQVGLAKFQSGDLDGAVVTLYEVVASYPSEPVREQAQFLIGDIFYTQKDYRGAVAELEGLIKAAPKSVRVPDALLKLGMAQRSLGDETQARRAWQRLVKDYPNSEAARQARALMRASKG